MIRKKAKLLITPNYKLKFMVFLLLFLSWFAGAHKACGQITITGQQSNGNVVFNYGGLLDVTGFSTDATPGGTFRFIGPTVTPGNTSPLFWNLQGYQSHFNVVASGPANYGTGGASAPTSVSGDDFGIGGFTDSVFVEQGFTSGVINGSMTFDDATFASLGVDEYSGPYVWTLIDGQTVILRFIGAVSQLSASATPMNLAAGKIASQVHRLSGHNFNQRIYRLRTRQSGGGGIASNDARSGRTVSAARLAKFGEKERAISSTINLSGRQETSRATTKLSEDDNGAGVLNSLAPTVTQEAGEVLASGHNWQLFAGADFGSYELDNIGNTSGFDSETSVGSVGFEYVVCDPLSIGVGWSHITNSSTVANNLGTVDVEGDAASVYASYFKNNLWGDLLYSYGTYQTDVQRNTGLGTVVNATPDIESHQISLNLGYNIACEDRFIHGPIFRADYNAGQLDGYTESGDLRSNTIFTDQEFESLVSTLGWQLNWCHNTCWGAMVPTFRAAYGRENLDQVTRSNGTLQNSPFVITNSLNNVAAGENWAEVGAGMGFEFNNCLSVFIDYQGQYFRENAQLHLGTIKAGWKF